MCLMRYPVTDMNRIRPHTLTRSHRTLAFIVAVAVVVASGCSTGYRFEGTWDSKGEQPSPPGPIEAVRTTDTIDVMAGRHLFARVHFRAAPKPFIFPVYGPDNVLMVRAWPMEDTNSDEAHDHPHHVSFWYAHGDVNGHDFWHSPDGAAIVNVGEPTLEVAEDHVIVICRYEWRDPDGVALCAETRRLTFRRSDDDERTIDVRVHLEALSEDLVFGDTKEGTMALRLNPRLRVKGKVAAGHMINSEGTTGKDCWGERARWVDVSGPIDERTVGVAIFDHPSNPRHPTWWHARDYGLLAANPFGIHDFERKPRGTGDLTVAAGHAITFQYRVWLHRGAGDPVRLDNAFSAFAAP